MTKRKNGERKYVITFDSGSMVAVYAKSSSEALVRAMIIQVGKGFSPDYKTVEIANEQVDNAKR